MAEARVFALSVRPYVSARASSGAAGSAFGYYYDVTAGQQDRDPFVLPALLASGDVLRVAAAKAAWEWLQADGAEIFRIICNFEGADDSSYNADLVKFVRVEQANDRVNFVFREAAAGAVSDAFLTAMCDEVHMGGDTWDCGDFGDVHAADLTVRCTLVDRTAEARALSCRDTSRQ